jgi:hypothetical protein
VEESIFLVPASSVQFPLFPFKSIFIIGIKTMPTNFSLLLLKQYSSVGEYPVTLTILQVRFPSDTQVQNLENKILLIKGKN